MMEDPVNLSDLFEILVINEKPNGQEDKVLSYLFGRRDWGYFRLVRAFIGLAHSNINLLRNRNQSRYNEHIDHLVEDMMELNIFESLKNYKEVQKKFCHLALGALGWDIKLLIKALSDGDNLKYANVFYNIYGCLNLGGILSAKQTYSDLEEEKMQIKALLRSVSKQVIGKRMLDGPKQLQGPELERNIQKFSEAALHRAGISNDFTDKFFTNIFKGVRDQNSLERFSPSKTYDEIAIAFSDGTILARLINSSKLAKNDRILLENFTQATLEIRSFFKSPNKSFEEETGQRVSWRLCEFIKCLKDSAKDRNLWEKVESLIPTIIKLFFEFQRKVEINSRVLSALKELISSVGDEAQRSLLSEIIRLMLNVDVKSPPNLEDRETNHRSNLEIYFNKVLPRIFPAIEKSPIKNLGIIIYETVIKRKQNLIRSSEDLKEMRYIIRDILIDLHNSGLKFIEIDKVKELIRLVNGELDACERFFSEFGPSNFIKRLTRSFGAFIEANDLLDSILASNPKSSSKAGKKIKTTDPDRWMLMVNKIKDGTANIKDLFVMVDEEGDQSGSISESEFNFMARRLGFKLSEHRVAEIFAKVKGDKVSTFGKQDLNQEEFEKAFGYLQEKNIYQVLYLLGITPEMLTGLLFSFIILLILVLAFIYIGIKAFTVGGTFGSIINSIIPAAGGMTLSKKREGDTDEVTEEKVVSASEASFDIVNNL